MSTSAVTRSRYAVRLWGLGICALLLGMVSMGTTCADLPEVVDVNDAELSALMSSTAGQAGAAAQSSESAEELLQAAQANPPTPDGAQPDSSASPQQASSADEDDDGTLIQAERPASVPNTQLKPIARWDVVPHQRVGPGMPFNVGVVAFSRYGIDRVRFIVAGQGYTGPSPIDVTKMTVNKRTGVCEYWTALYAEDFTSDGPITVEAEVYGNDGGVRTKDSDGGGVGLDPLGLVVNATGALPQVQAWVSTSGNDGVGVVNDRTQPFGTIGGAMNAIQRYRSANGFGNNGDGGIVRLMPGMYNCSNGGIAGPIACDYEWITITADVGSSAGNTTLLPGGIPGTRKVHVKNLTLQGAGTLGMSASDRAQAKMWVDNCRLIGSGRNVPGAHPIGCEWGRLFYTDSSITEVQQATSGSALCRNLSIARIGDDAFQNVAMVVNCVVDDVDPQGSGAHADVWQHGMGNDSNKLDDNVIVYNLIATNIQYQSIFIRGDINSAPTMAQGMAFVNVYTRMRDDSYGFGGWGRWVDHLLWWNCTFATKGIGIMSDSYAGSSKYPCRITNWSVRGCDFAFFGSGGADTDWGGWWDNHFVDGSSVVGQNATTGWDAVDGSGVPQARSPLVDRMDVVVPVDARNEPRDVKADIGAFER